VIFSLSYNYTGLLRRFGKLLEEKNKYFFENKKRPDK
jgi:hypothetical protein